jgi:hypothetical protein
MQAGGAQPADLLDTGLWWDHIHVGAKAQARAANSR